VVFITQSSVSLMSGISAMADRCAEGGRPQ
jgi:hypothetical protein